MLNKAFAVFIMLGVGLFSAQALEIQRGKVKLVINERNGRFSLYATQDLASPNFQPLWLAEDPTTSKIKVFVDDRVSVLGDDRDFSLTTEAIPTGAKAVWSSKNLRVVQTFEFLTSASSSVVDGVKVSFSLVNLTESQSLKVGLRFVLDTFLGEKKNHFLLPSGDPLNSETRFDTLALPEYLVSPSALDDKVGLLLMLGKSSTPATKVILANWKRLDDSNWDFSYRQGRDFNQLPYSYNDSALALFWDPQPLAGGQTRDINLLMGCLSAKTFAAAQVGSSNPLNDILTNSKGKEALGPDQALAQDSQVLDDLLKQLDEKLKNSKDLTDDDLKLMQNALDQLEQRKKLYSAPSPTKE